jgi:hypothetical protein
VDRGRTPGDPDEIHAVEHQPAGWGRFQPFAGGVQRAVAGIRRFEAPIKAAGRFTVVTAAVSFAGWLVTSVIQYNSWRTENDLKRYEEELTQATKTFADASDAFSKALTLQQQLVFNYVDALDSADKNKENDKDKGRTEFLWGQAHSVLDDYRKARTELRQTIGVMTRRAEIYIDWPSKADRKNSEKVTPDDPLTVIRVDEITTAFTDRLKNPKMDKTKIDPLTISAVEGGEVDCDTLIPQGNNIDKWGTSPASRGATATVDWGSTKHHLIVLYACFAQDNNLSEPIRRWASPEKSGNPSSIPAFLPADAERRQRLAEDFKRHFNLQTERLDKFNVLAMTRIAQIQFKNQPPGYICHTIGFFCSDPGRPR